MLKKNKNSNLANLKGITLGFNLGFVIAIPPIIGTFIGLYIDRWLSTKPIFTIILILLGTIAGTYSAIKEAKKLIK